MISVTIDESIKERCPEAVLGLLQCKVNVHPDDEEFLALLNSKIAELSEVELSQANKRDYIQSTRKAYKALGKEPNRYRNSCEAMCRRIAKERGLYYINNVVDINNYLLFCPVIPWVLTIWHMLLAASPGNVPPKAPLIRASAKMC